VVRAALAFLFALIVGGAVCGVAFLRLAPPSPASTSTDDPAAVTATPVDEPMKHIPDWVQTNRTATLWSSPDRDATAFTSLPAWTFLKVTGAEGGRLSVEYAGDGQSRQPGPGWVSLVDVQPSDAGDGWLRNHRASQLFADPTTSSSTMDVAQWSWMLSLGDSQAGRLHVRLYASTLRSLVADGWIPSYDVGPSGPPEQAVYTASTKPSAAEALPPDAFISTIAAAAATAQSDPAQLPVSVTIAQAILESNWGQSALSREANNYFGIKATRRIGNDGAVWMPTLETAQGGSYTVVAPFRAYRSLADSVADHAALLEHAPAYRDALQAVGSPDEFARRIGEAGYSTDPAYADKLIALMHNFDLYQYDARPAASATAATQPAS
jgi:hypothetical protein